MYAKSAITWTIAVLLFATSNAASVATDGRATGEIAISTEQFRETIEGKVGTLPAVKLEAHEYSALQSDIDRSGIKPIATCSALYQDFVNDNFANFQKWANNNCKNYVGVWCCPSGGECIFFVVKPIVICRLTDPIYIPKIPVWEWPQQVAQTGAIAV